ncbi:HNH endonuclease signature motif containing protein [Microbacterium deminutum]|uniref:HNH endonuclease signature motif containing protein n=1 Tax=Microbacterium deminutum TaxID=344164 RepID=A0ABP5C264_9MICO
MSTKVIPDSEPDEFEAWLWAERVAIAESWGFEPEPGPETGDIVDPAADAIDRPPAVARFIGAQLHREQLLGQWEQAATEVARWQAVQARILAESLDLCLADGDSRPGTTLSVRSFAAELACAVRMSDRTVEQHMNDAQVLRDRFGATFGALRDGILPRAHAQVIADEGIRLSDDTGRAEYERIVLDLAAQLTTGRLRAVAKAVAEQLMATTLDDRHADARTRRRVHLRDVDDGMTELWALLPTALARGIEDRLTRFAHAVRDAEREAISDDAHLRSGVESKSQPESADPTGPDASPQANRTLDQLRVDAFCDLLLTGHASTAAIDRDGGARVDAIRGVVQITVPVQTLTEGTCPAAYLADRCPIDSESARRIAAAASIWHHVITDPLSGDVVAVHRRFPSEAQRRHLRARDEHCRFPGCRIPVWRCDVDHTVDHQHGGATSVCNLAHLCRRHHTMKHNTAWRVEQHEAGVLVWTSPLGRIYADRPSPTLRFMPTRA